MRPRVRSVPSAVTISGVNPGTSTLTVSTSTNTPGGNYAITVNASDANKLAPSNGAQALTLTTAAVIQHVVIIFQENRTPDNLFHDPVLIARGADIASSGKNSLGQTIPLTPIDLGTSGANPQNYDLGHSHGSFVQMYDGGKMDGANLINCYPAAKCPPCASQSAIHVRQSGRRSALLRIGRAIHVRRPHVSDQPRSELSRSPVHHFRNFGSYSDQFAFRLRKYAK